MSNQLSKEINLSMVSNEINLSMVSNEINLSMISNEISSSKQVMNESNAYSKESLQKVMNEFKESYEDNTDFIRQEKRSSILRDDILRMERLKRSYEGDRCSDEFRDLCASECSYLFTNYTIIFNKLLKDVLDLKIMFRTLEVLRQIEEGAINQEEGSVLVGKMFADMYLDAAKREGEIRDAEQGLGREEPVEGKAISWKQFKQRSAFIS